MAYRVLVMKQGLFGPILFDSGQGRISQGGLGEQSPTFLKVGVDGLVILGYIFLIHCC